MNCHLVIQPLDYQYDFLDEIGKNSLLVFEPKIGSFEVSPVRTLPKHLLLAPASFFGRLIMRRRKMIHLDDLRQELKTYWTYDPKQIILAILPHFIIEFGFDMTALYLKANLSVISTYGMKEKYLPQGCIGISLHEIGHNVGLRHCKTKGCIMRRPSKPKNFREGIYKLCNRHREKFEN